MKLERATQDHLRQIMPWFPDRSDCLIWGGPQFRHPFTEASFVEDSRLHDLPSFVLVAANGGLLAFGQYYERIGRCHLGRLVVSPEHRGHGIGRWLIAALVERGAAELGASESSLFVAAENVSAVALYRKLGFAETTYPENAPNFAPYLYMVAPVAAVLEKTGRR